MATATERAAWRAQVRARHAPALANVPASSCTAARAHKRWVLVEQAEETSDDSAKASSSLGLNFDADDQTVRNDYSAFFVDSGLEVPPGAWIQNPGMMTRFAEHPKLRHLLDLKAQLVDAAAIPPTYLRADLRAWLPAPTPPNLGVLETLRYDVILVDPPLASYAWAAPHEAHACWTWDEIGALPVPQLASRDSFVFLWVGDGAHDGLERGREVLHRWGYRRCEDIVWVQSTPQSARIAPSDTPLLAPSVQHCLMGIRGTVVRSSDAFFVHCNIDTDVIVWPGEPTQPGGPISPVPKPPELYEVIERFCLGTRRLELFGTNRNIRRGWLTIGAEVGEPGVPPGAVPMDPAQYLSYFVLDPPQCPLAYRHNVVPYSPLCEKLRPRTPPGRRSEPGAPLLLRQLLGQGAGGRATVSVPSGDERFSGAQAKVRKYGSVAER
ncbi:mRNA (2'-O-methyladenosine-N(6)-)-methyltransferase [Malassezia equina]|uniref:mRNA (2'-O-methyladenosine-N(6)-)-methyltransferase n=1 Tax=Malassezia equina TaxID=1381935 RepID=A0AAF0IY19_9BASI|nr:mRNA (2'-O-methyladenosine-N(6)-)-methyltransferase [Malassezia equina]